MVFALLLVIIITVVATRYPPGWMNLFIYNTYTRVYPSWMNMYVFIYIIQHIYIYIYTYIYIYIYRCGNELGQIRQSLVIASQLDEYIYK